MAELPWVGGPGRYDRDEPVGGAASPAATGTARQGQGHGRSR